MTWLKYILRVCSLFLLYYILNKEIQEILVEIKIQATLVIPTPDKSILLLISKWNLSPNIFFFHLLFFNYGYLKVWITRNYGYLKVDFQPQTRIFICFNTAYLKVWFVKLKKHTFDAMMNTDYHIFCGRNLKLITMSHFHRLPSPVHIFYALTK